MADPQPDQIPSPDFPPSFWDFPILRTTLFITGVDMRRTIDDLIESGRYTAARDLFRRISVNQYPDTSSTRRIISNSLVEIVSGLSIVALVTALVRLYYTRPGMVEYDPAHLGPGRDVEIPILAALFTFFALIAAAFTWLAMNLIVRTPRLGTFLPFTSPPLEPCGICRESAPLTGLVSLQCSSDEEEAANPGRARHYYHEDCLELWWGITIANRGRCPICNQMAVAYRRVDAEYRYPAPEPSAIMWAIYSFFMSVLFFWGHMDPTMARGFPRIHEESYGSTLSVVLVRGIGHLCVSLVARLFLAKALYALYDSIHMWCNDYATLRFSENLVSVFRSFDLAEVEKFIHTVLSGPNTARFGSTEGMFSSAIAVLKNLFLIVWQVFKNNLTESDRESLEALLGGDFDGLKNLLRAYFSPDRSKLEVWLHVIAITVLSLIFIHGLANRVSELIYELSRFFNRYLIRFRGPFLPLSPPPAPFLPPILDPNQPLENLVLPPPALDNQPLLAAAAAPARVPARTARESVALFVRTMGALWYGIARFATRGVGIANPQWWHIHLSAILYNGFVICVLSNMYIGGGAPLAAYLENALEVLGYGRAWEWFILFFLVPAALWVLCAALYVFYLTVWLTLFDDILPSVLVMTMTYTSLEFLISFLSPWASLPPLSVGDWCAYWCAFIITVLFWLPLILERTGAAWFVGPRQ